MNKELSSIAQGVIVEMREEGWDEDDIKWSTCGALLKHCEAHGTIEDEPDKYDLAAIETLVKQCLKGNGDGQ